MENEKLVYVIVLTYNGKRWIDNCLNSVLKTNYSNFKVLVIDNASKDGVAKYIEKKFPQVMLIKNKKNYGFARGNNIGIKFALRNNADYIVLLNQDTKVDPNWICELIKVSEKDKQIGILSPMQYDYDGKNIDRNFLNNILKFQTNFIADQAKNKIEGVYDTNKIIGAAMMLTRKIIEEIGLFDQMYFLYAEEEDFCRRALFHGFRIVIVTTSRIQHWHSLVRDFGKSKKIASHFLKSQCIFFLKDPNRSFLSKLFEYYFNGGAIKIAAVSGLRKRVGNMLRFILVQLWIVAHIFLIWNRVYKDRFPKAFII